MEGSDIGNENSMDDTPMSDTPLAWADGAGHEEVVKLQLGWASINPDPDEDGKTSLGLAIGYGHERIVEIQVMR